MKYNIHKVTVKELEIARNTGRRAIPFYQRGEVSSWKKNTAMVNWLDTLINGYPTTPIFCESFNNADSKNRIYKLIDGQQRTAAIARICDGTFTLTEESISLLPEFLKEFYSPLLGMDFDNWPASYKNNLLNYTFTVIEVVEASEEEILILFDRLQKGKPLTPSQSKRGVYLPKLSQFNDFLNADGFKKAGLKQSEIETILMQLVKSSIEESPSYDATALVQSFIDCNVTDDLVLNLEKVAENFSTLMKYHSEADEDSAREFKKCLKKTHVESILFALLKDNEDALRPELVYNRIMSFFSMKGDSRTSEKIAYNDASLQNTASVEAVKTRHEIMVKVINGTALKAIVPEPKEKIQPLKKPSEVKSSEKKNKRGHSTAELMQAAEQPIA